MNALPCKCARLLILVAGAFLVGACASGELGAPPAADLDQVRIVLLPYLGYSPFHLGIESGLFEAEGIELVSVDVRRSSEAMPALVEGEIDVVPGTLYPGLFNAIARGAPIRLVAGTHYIEADHCTTLAMLARTGFMPPGESPSAGLFSGARADINVPSLPGFVAASAFGELGMTFDDFEIVDIPPPSEAEAYLQGSLDLSIADEPWLTRLIDSGQAQIWARGEELVPDLQFGVIAFGPSLLEGDRGLGARFLRAYLRSVQLYQEGKTPENIEIVSNSLDLEAELVNAVCWPAFRSDGSVNLESVQQFQEWALENGHLDRVVDPEEYWEPELLQGNLTGDSGADA